MTSGRQSRPMTDRDEGDADMRFSFSKVKRMAPVVPETPTVARRMPTPAQRMPLRMEEPEMLPTTVRASRMRLHCSTGPTLRVR